MKKKVLVIDDDADTRSLLAEVLKDFCVDVFEAAQDDEGYQLFLEVGPDLVLLDVLLPRQGGLALLRKLRGVRGGREVPVLVMSAVYRSNDVRAEAVDNLGAADFLKKPFQMETLRTRLSEILVDEESEEHQDLPGIHPTEVLNRGNLSGTSFPILLKDLGFHRTTGRLNVRQAMRRRSSSSRTAKSCSPSPTRSETRWGDPCLQRDVFQRKTIEPGSKQCSGTAERWASS